MAEPIKKLYRSRTNRMLFGVCGGLGEYFDIDPTIFRILFIVLTLFNGLGIFLYIVLAIIVPQEGSTYSPPQGSSRAEDLSGMARKKADELAGEIKVNGVKGMDKRSILGALIVIFGLVILGEQVFPLYFRWMNWTVIGSVMVILVGAYLILKK